MEKNKISTRSCKRINTKDSHGNRNGWLLEVLSERDNFVDNLKGQVYLTIVNAGQEKGFHVHTKATYHVCCILGNIKSILYLDQSRKREISMGGDNLVVIKMEPGVAHLMKNIGNEPAYVLVYRYPAWSPAEKEQIDIAPEDIEKPETWKKIKAHTANK